ncbi:MAG: hypothetical protein IT307_10375 [Chloroflexi bacterium]|nr:hypothetical protein [Chloroflexota bacterium]
MDVRVLGQWNVDRLPDGPLMLRVTELEMEPGARIFDHSNLGVGGHFVISGTFTVVDSVSGEATDFGPGAGYYEGMTGRRRAVNRNSDWNRQFMAELLPRSRGFLGNFQFDQDGVTHNEGGIRSGPYLQQAVDAIPEGPVMVRMSEITMGPKAKTPAYTRPGPALFFVQSGQATFRHEALGQIVTQGAGGYYLDPGVEPIMLENKPIVPATVIAVEFLPRSLGRSPSTVPS